MKKSAVKSILTMILVFICASCSAEEKLSLMLDWFPNIDHLPIYVAEGKGFFRENDIEVDVLVPSETADALKLAASGKVDIAVAYEPQVIAAASRGIPIKAGARLMKHPLSTLLYLDSSGITDIMDLNGKTIGYTVPGMMDVLAGALARIHGLRDIRLVNVGFSIAQSLVSGKVDAIMGPYKNYETVALELEGISSGYFAIEEHGIPDYDELVFITSQENAERSPEQLRSFALAIEKAAGFIKSNPSESVKIFLETLPESSRELEARAFEKTIGLYAEEVSLNESRWQIFADFALEYGIIEKPVDVREIITNWR